MYTLYYWPRYCSLAAHIVLNWAQAKYTLFKADETYRKSADFLALNPSGTVPVLNISTKNQRAHLSQNVAILHFIAQEFPETHLLGDGSILAQAEILRWASYINSDVHKCFTPLLHPERVSGGKSAQILAETSAFAMLAKHFTILDNQMREQNWLVNNQRSIADPYLFVILRWAKMLAVSLDSYPALANFYRSFIMDKAVLSALEQEGVSTFE